MSGILWTELCVPCPKFMILNKIVFGDRGFGKWLGHEGRVLTVGLVPFWGNTLELAAFPSLHHVKKQDNNHLQTRKKALTKNPDLRLCSLQNFP